MGYTLTIGEPSIMYDPESFYMDISVDSIHCVDAPAFDEPTDRTSSRWPSYTTWADFSDWAGLGALFPRDRRIQDCDKALIQTHPGVAPITLWHKEQIDSAYEAKKNITPTYANEDTDEGMMCRLVWLKYWVDYALKNLERPTFENS